MIKEMKYVNNSDVKIHFKVFKYKKHKTRFTAIFTQITNIFSNKKDDTLCVNDSLQIQHSISFLQFEF